ncbi:hypothetical protein ASE88_12680 [Sphingomonas sp. Leaf38]|nr:hypothetical protein ASE88_12680 [Sphingomonas sp. Leaf38]
MVSLNAEKAQYFIYPIGRLFRLLKLREHNLLVNLWIEGPKPNDRVYQQMPKMHLHRPTVQKCAGFYTDYLLY